MISAGGQPRPDDERSPLPIAPVRPDPHAPPPEFVALVEEHSDFIWRLLRRLGLSASDAEDAVQQVFLLADEKLAEIEAGKERAFLYGIALRVAANARRAARRRREVPDSELAPSASGDPMPDRLLEMQRARELLDELLAELPEELSRVLVLAEVEKHTLSAIAELEALPRGTVASRLRRARTLFRECLARQASRNPFKVDADE